MPNTGNNSVGNSKTVQYLNLSIGSTTFTIDYINMFRFVHFIRNNVGKKQKVSCSPYSCTYCASGNKRTMRLMMDVTHNSVAKLLEVSAALGHNIINKYSAGDTITIERCGTGYGTTYTINGQNMKARGIPNALSDSEKEEGYKEMMYDLQRSADFADKSVIIKTFVRKYL